MLIERDAVMIPANSRNHGIDILKITAMLFVVILHFLGHGGVLDNVSRGTGTYYAAWGLEIWCYCTVDIFALISGYCGFRGDKVIPNISRYVMLWLEVVFYSIVIRMILAAIYSEPVSARDMLHMMTPVTSRAYWYFRAYTGAFIVMPLLNSAVNYLSKARCRKMIVIIAVALPVLSVYSDPFELGSGYGAAWISLMYLLGALIRKTGAFSGTGTKLLIASGLALYVITFLSYVIADSPDGMLGIHLSLVNYVSPTIVLISVIWLELFRRIKISNRTCTSVISALSAGAFSVYLIDDNGAIRSHFISSCFAGLANAGPAKLLATVLITSVVLTLACMCADIVRRKLFKAVKIDRLAKLIERNGKTAVTMLADIL